MNTWQVAVAIGVSAGMAALSLARIQIDQPGDDAQLAGEWICKASVNGLNPGTRMDTGMQFKLDHTLTTQADTVSVDGGKTIRARIELSAKWKLHRNVLRLAYGKEKKLLSTSVNGVPMSAFDTKMSEAMLNASWKLPPAMHHPVIALTPAQFIYDTASGPMMCARP